MAKKIIILLFSWTFLFHVFFNGMRRMYSDVLEHLLDDVAILNIFNFRANDYFDVYCFAFGKHLFFSLLQNLL